MQAFELVQLISQQQFSDKPYFEFLRVPDLSMGLYVLPAGGTDSQSPHTEDEVYYVVSGGKDQSWGGRPRGEGKLDCVCIQKYGTTASTRLRKS